MMQWEKNLRKVKPYVAGEQPNEIDMIKINTNENPYPPAPSVFKRYKELELEELRLYSDPNATELVRALEEYHGLEPGQVFTGVGSDDVLAMAFLTFFNSKKPILFPDITYSFYPVWAAVYQIPYETPALNERLEINAADYYKENGGVIIANPNAPSSLVLPLDAIEDILLHNQDVIVIIDEAYIDFGGESALTLMNQYENLLVVRTYSKSRSMAGMRIGYAMGNKQLIKAMTDVKESVNSYTMSQIAISLGAASLSDDDYFYEKINQIVETRNWTKRELEECGFHVLDSATNFLFAEHKQIPASYLFEELRKKKIYVRYFNQPRIDNFLRISIGTERQMEEVLKVLRESIAAYA